ncbi:hypothetical protein SAMN04515647_1055 [Cohaesibacter sp. ES.047]|uniref:hypothetical protein n=1 Tax=Cohaesibacter sp. ES.047 TaxID=1798205 RepID=UPI000BB963C8|nr:hypothetical protein [Cohaesibacter sp. ES.047]SNY90878.1 hypothetical protein SAMN04515647_1055 [Cohaesibacter sp. ES.047]
MFSRSDPAETGLLQKHAATVSHVFFTLLLCLAITVIPISAHFVSPILAIFCQFLLATGVALFFPAMAPMIVVFSLVFQNMFVSIFSGYIAGLEDYNFVRGYNFLTMMILWIWIFGTYALNWRQYGRPVNRIMLVCLFGFALIGLYLLVGMAKNPAGAIIYLRNVISPLIIFQIFLLSALRYDQPMLPFFTGLSVIILVLGFIEMIDRELWLDLVNGWKLWEVGNREAILYLAADKVAAETGQFVTSILDTFKVAFLNTPLLGDNSFVILRLMGPNNHAISYSYLLAFLALLMIMNGRWYLAVLMVPLLLFASAKGSLIMLFLAFCALVARWLFGAAFGLASLVVVLMVYIGLGIVTGLQIGDFHVLGFMGGVYNFLVDPFGNGLGDAGNLVSDFNKLDWQAYQAAGRTPIAMESAVGVMLHQMGFAALGLLGVYFWIGFQTYRVSFVSRVTLHSMACFSLFVVVVNGIFQEEAIFSPLALGLVIGLNGHILGRAFRDQKRVGASHAEA